MSKKKKKTKAGGGKSKILYWIAGIVILIPVLLLGWIYLSAKESSGSPTVGSRFDNSLNPAITEEQLDKVKSAMKLDGVESVEVNLISATLRINIDTKDDASSAKVKSIMNEAYDKVNDILPIKKYFTNNDSDRCMIWKCMFIISFRMTSILRMIRFIRSRRRQRQRRSRMFLHLHLRKINPSQKSC